MFGTTPISLWSMSALGRDEPRHVAFVHRLGSAAVDADVIIALTPQAIRDCATAGLPTSVLDDHVDRGALLQDQDDYLRWQLDWLNRLDRLGAGGNGSVRAAAHLIKTPIDSAVMATRLLRAAILATGARRVTYVGPHGPDERDLPHQGHLQFWPMLGDVPLAARLLPILAEDLRVEYEELVVDEPTSAPPSPNRLVAGSGGPLVPRLAAIRNLGGLRPRSRSRSATLVLWYAGYGLRRFARAERLRGCRVLALQRGEFTTRVLEPSPWGFRSLGPQIVLLRESSAHRLSPELTGLLDEVDTWAGAPGVGAILGSRIERYVFDICAAVDRAASQLQPQLVDAQVDRVAAANPSSIEEFAALLAAKRAGGIRRTLLQHGDQLLSYDPWPVTETQNFDEVLSSDPTAGADLKKAAHALGEGAPSILPESPRVESLRLRGSWRPARRATTDMTVCYVPTPYVGDSYVLGGSYFDDAWYYRWQSRLLECMTRKTQVRFIWKALPRSNQAPDPLESVIREHAHANVVYESRPLLHVLAGVDRVIVDFPSTALYEAVHFRKPVLALSFRRFAQLRSSAAAACGPVLRECDDEIEALDAIEAFLESAAHDWVLTTGHLYQTGTPAR